MEDDESEVRWFVSMLKQVGSEYEMDKTKKDEIVSNVLSVLNRRCV
jgi:hypothetical protein